MMKNVIFGLTTFLIFCVGVSKAATFEVSSANDISSLSPSPGDIIILQKEANWEDQDIELTFSGTETSPIYIQAEGSGEVVLSGSSSLQIGGSYLEIDGLSFINCVSTEGNDLVKFKTSAQNATHCRLTNCYFFENNPSDVETGYKWVSLYGRHNRVDHCWFEGKEHRGTTLVVWLDNDDADPNYHQIDHNYFTRPEYTSGNNEAETIRIGDSKTSLIHSYTTVEYNYFEQCDGEIESISNKSCYNTYRYNTFYNNKSILTLRHGHYCTVEGNYFFGNNASGSGGVRIIGIGHQVINNYFQDIAGSGNLRSSVVIMGGVDGLGIDDATNRYVASEDAVVAFNTFVNCNQNVYVGSDKTKSSDGEEYKAPSNCTIDNNIIYNGEDPCLKFEFDEIGSFSYAGNIYYNTDLGKSSSDGFTNVDPLLQTNTGLNAYRLTASSPAIDASSGSYSLDEDFDGQPRTGTKDVGCDEYSTSDVERSPVEKTQVGPCWKNADACEVVVDEEDCNGVVNGTASIDDCGVCSGGNTGKTPNSDCEQDCNNVWDGTASIDNCGVCSGGNTGVEVDACLACESVIATSDDGNLPVNTLDDNLGTRWSAQGLGEYLEFCLDDEQTINSISIGFYKGDERTTTFDLEYSTDGVNWNSILTNQTSSGLTLEKELFEFTATLVWKIRVIGQGNSSNDWNSITEVSWGVVSNEDCAGVANGTASIDDCGVCSGGTTDKVANATCEDCAGVANGTASIDDCGVCSGGTTGKVANATCEDCAGVANGTASIDDCGVCSGGTTSKVANATCEDCAGVANGNAYIDDCNECVAGTTGKSPCGNDCAGVPGGSAFLDNCNECVGGTTGKVANATCEDCAGVANGNASIDDCGVCSGGTTGKVANATCEDCEGVANGNASIDDCGVCSGGTTGKVANATCEDCAGVANGNASIDDCGVCSGGTTGKVANATCEDCAGVANGNASVDDCNVCSGGTTDIEVNACTTTSTITELENENIELHPNPTDRKIFISEEKNWVLVSPSGVKLASGEGKEIDLESCSPGVYFIYVGQQVFRIMKY